MVQASTSVYKRWAWIPNLPKEVWILSIGQLLLFVGQGFTMVYASIYFVNELGFSTTQVGLALGSSGLSGILGRFWAGSAIDSPSIGRRKILFISTIIAAIACCCLAFATTFPLLVAGNLLMGMGLSLFWPATMAVTTDLTTEENRTEAFAIARLADNLGLGLGAFLAGQYIALSGSYQALFLGKGAAYLVCGIVVYFTITETLSYSLDTSPSSSANPVEQTDHTQDNSAWEKWKYVFRDRPFFLYLFATIFFTTYTAQLSSTLPLYLANFIPGGNTPTGFSEQWISYFFVWHALLKILFQLPITRWVNQFAASNILMTALGTWIVGFGLIWLTSLSLPTVALVSMIGAFTLISAGEILYGPTASSIVGAMAPAELRGVYFSLDSQCWAAGYLIGPILGGWALDHPTVLGTNIWIVLGVSVTIAIAFIQRLKKHIIVPA